MLLVWIDYSKLDVNALSPIHTQFVKSYNFLFIVSIPSVIYLFHSDPYWILH